jgi:hypothetical protein
MNQEDLFRKLGLILNELNEQYQFLAENPQQLSDLELELFQANANFLADHVQIIKKINDNQSASNFAMADEKQYASGVITNEFQDESQLEEITFANQTADENPQVDQIVEEASPEPEIEEIESEVFRLDQSPSTFEFILNDHAEHETIDGIPPTNYDQYAQDNFIDKESLLKGEEKFEFDEKSVDELFNRPLSEEEEQILAQKRKLKEQTIEDDFTDTDEDEIGPEPF